MLVGASRLGDGSANLGAADPFLLGVAPVGGHAVLGGGLAASATTIGVTFPGVGLLSTATLEQPEAPLWVRFK